METLLTIVGTSITLVSFIYAIIQGRQLKKLQEFNRENSWELFRQTVSSIAAIQRIDVTAIPNKEIAFEFGRINSTLQEIAMKSIGMIKRFEKEFDEKMIAEWKNSGKLENETNVHAFKKLL